MSLQYHIENANQRYWRTDFKLGRNVYVLLSNDVNRPSSADPLIGTMESSALAEEVVETHNLLLEKFGRRFRKVVEQL